jgi:hypothetical protein
MSNYHVELIDKPAALTKEAIKSLRKQQVQGLSRRQLMRAAIGTGIGLWLLEVTAGTLAFAWPNLSGGFGAPSREYLANVLSYNRAGVIRAKIVLLASKGRANDAIGARLDTPRQIVSKWRRRFYAEEIEAVRAVVIRGFESESVAKSGSSVRFDTGNRSILCNESGDLCYENNSGRNAKVRPAVIG